MNLLNAGCGTHYAQGWVNVDVWVSETTKPDVVAKSNEPYPFEDNYFDAIFLGHVLEHISWPKVPAFLSDMSRIAKPNAPILIVGPDVYKTMNRWKDGLEPWSMVEAVIEHQDFNHQPEREHEWWDGAAHHWNCHESRIIKLVQDMGFTNIENIFEKIPNDPNGYLWFDEKNQITWPVVGKYFWQLCVLFTNKN